MYVIQAPSPCGVEMQCILQKYKPSSASRPILIPVLKNPRDAPDAVTGSTTGKAPGCLPAPATPRNSNCVVKAAWPALAEISAVKMSMADTGGMVPLPLALGQQATPHDVPPLALKPTVAIREQDWCMNCGETGHMFEECVLPIEPFEVSLSCPAWCGSTFQTEPCFVRCVHCLIAADPRCACASAADCMMH